MSVSRQSGFSLVEMLAALAVVSLAGLALMQAMTTAGRSAIHARERALAAVAAESVMNTLILEARSVRRLRETSGTYSLAGTDYDWTITLEETPDPGLERVTLTLSDARGPVHELVTFRKATP
ncbi:type II secretion system protein GspI [Marinicauda salina]|uniref:Type II secretion system protein I n=1 Tax=Marinicauda salina TaxID=2135793 RepID=A0A2U2BSX3_9PROT|nr:type II secretion system minor pseudopilin GspI [Marinicauda salina]PWE17113.1 type II secretion system protein GspI [Marinicauda salina]